METSHKPEVQSIRIDWAFGLGNSPSLDVFVDDGWDYRPYNDIIHRELIPDLWFAEDAPWAHFVFVHKDSRYPRGACTGNLKIGPDEYMQVANGWSSRAGVVNTHLPEESHVCDVTLYGGRYKSGRAGIAMLVSAVRECLPGAVHLVREEKYGTDIVYTPSITPDVVTKPNSKE